MAARLFAFHGGSPCPVALGGRRHDKGPIRGSNVGSVELPLLLLPWTLAVPPGEEAGQTDSAGNFPSSP